MIPASTILQGCPIPYRPCRSSPQGRQEPDKGCPHYPDRLPRADDEDCTTGSS